MGLALRAIMKEPDEDWDSKVFLQFPCDYVPFQGLVFVVVFWFGFSGHSP